ncbi:MAG: hypothetical protein BGO51_11055 [Rhodospirillales bacterium 69-11]|nr:hypothetical protein [Rhodospirillales bacterium]MBN8930024.1 hypothetical protein [Rhodospirillales bacterium]OJW29575.1 MAG: hypothetical protein BGO51_11055 [Rhodospirillales bacterium 69-11]
MKRIGLPLVAGGVLLLALIVVLATMAGVTTMPSYLATWLFWTALPVGALPVVMLLDLIGTHDPSPFETALRRMTLLMPLAMLMMVPVLIWPDTLFGWTSGHEFATPFGQAWMTRGAFIGRSVGYFVIWLLLTLIFSTRPSPYGIGRRRGFAAFGLCVYALTATLAAVDWAMTVEPDWYSGVFGLLLIATQVSIAVSVALLLAGGEWRRVAHEPASGLLLLAVGGWAFMHLIQFLVIWSGNKPADIVWYLHRRDLGSQIVVWIGVVAGLVAPMLLLEPGWRSARLVMPVVALGVLCAQALGMLWMVTPSLRHHFTVSGMDALSFIAIGALMVGACLWPGPIRTSGHGASSNA